MDEQPKKFNLFSIITTILSAISIIKIIEDCNLIELYGALNEWFKAYSTFIHTIGDFLFGWIQLTIDLAFLKLIFQIEQIEYHSLIISNLFTSSFWKSLSKIDFQETNKNKYKIIIATYTVIIINFVILTLLTILFPSIITIILTILLPLIYFSIITTHNTTKINKITPQNKKEKTILLNKQISNALTSVTNTLTFANELKNTFILFIIIIVLNYSIFKII